MAPDINTMPASPRREQPQSPVHTARRHSQHMPPPPLPQHPTHAQQWTSPRNSMAVNAEQPGVPLRHPRPLTATELYLECEKEQEAVVNRLTRELTALRAQSASVASNASLSSTSTSASLLPVDITDPNPTHQLTGATHPTPSRRHRSSSSLSARSLTNTGQSSTGAATGGSIANSGPTGSQVGVSSGHLGGISQASADRAAAAGGMGILSRQPSMTTSGSSTPARHSLDMARHNYQPGSFPPPHRPSMSRDPSYTSQLASPSSVAAHAGTPMPAHASLPPPPSSHTITYPSTTDTAAYRSEMEIVKAENEALRQRVRALERALRQRRRDSSNSDVAHPDLGATRANRDRDSSAFLNSPEARPTLSPGVAAWAANDGGVGGVAPPRERSESQSTTASSRRGVPAEDDVRFGESAGNAGIMRGS